MRSASTCSTLSGTAESFDLSEVASVPKTSGGKRHFSVNAFPDVNPAPQPQIGVPSSAR